MWVGTADGPPQSSSANPAPHRNKYSAASLIVTCSTVSADAIRGFAFVGLQRSRKMTRCSRKTNPLTPFAIGGGHKSDCAGDHRDQQVHTLGRKDPRRENSARKHRGGCARSPSDEPPNNREPL